VTYYLMTHPSQDPLSRSLGSGALAFALNAALGTAVTIAGAVLSYRFYERPFLALKEVLAPQHS
jgi:peptidoglycan/LPS O-acetylase OafA/YrhL